MKNLTITLAALLFCATAALSQPFPSNCEDQPSRSLNGFFFAPDNPPLPASVETITIRNVSNVPILNSFVEIVVSSSTVLCPATVLSGYTDSAGEVTITLGGGGCAHGVPNSGTIFADGIYITSYDNVKSPDYDGASGSLGVTISDLVSFSGEFLNTSTDLCHDYDNNGTTGLSDLILFAPAFSNPNVCP